MSLERFERAESLPESTKTPEEVIKTSVSRSADEASIDGFGLQKGNVRLASGPSR